MGSPGMGGGALSDMLGLGCEHSRAAWAGAVTRDQFTSPPVWTAPEVPNSGQQGKDVGLPYRTFQEPGCFPWGLACHTEKCNGQGELAGLWERLAPLLPECSLALGHLGRPRVPFFMSLEFTLGQSGQERFLSG